MRHLFLRLAPVALAALAPIVPACSSQTNASSASSDAGEDAAIGPGQLEGAPCDPTLPDPCLQAPCTVVTCDPGLQVCEGTPINGPCRTTEDASFSFDASDDTGTVVVPSCSGVADCPPIPSSLDGGAPTLRACAFSAFDGCNAPGVCVIPDPPHVQDGAVLVACGCDDQPVAYVTDTQTSAPVQSPSACAASSPGDAGADAAPEGDAASASDGSSDGSALVDAGDDGG
jgi:hypothetical protein